MTSKLYGSDEASRVRASPDDRRRLNHLPSDDPGLGYRQPVRDGLSLFRGGLMNVVPDDPWTGSPDALPYSALSITQLPHILGVDYRTPLSRC